LVMAADFALGAIDSELSPLPKHEDCVTR